MDSLKLIPSIFFDAIARVVPGAAAIVAYLLLVGSTWSRVLSDIFGPALAEGEARLTAVGLFFFSAYVVGQMISPFAKLAQRIGEWKRLRPKSEAPSGAYDFLRLHYTDAGSQCAKIRAEFTMFNGLTMVFLASSISYRAFTTMWKWPELLLLLGATIATAIRGRTVRDTFHQTVSKFAKATTFPDPPAAQQAAAAVGASRRS